jgi:hypothetical protein
MGKNKVNINNHYYPQVAEEFENTRISSKRNSLLERMEADIQSRMYK